MAAWMKRINIIWKIMIIIVIAVGVSIQLGIFQGQWNIHILNYFTILSNLFAAIILGISVFLLAKEPKQKPPYIWAPRLKGMAIVCLMITMIVSHFLLNQSFQMTGVMGFSITLVHYVSPLMILVDYLIFDTKGCMKKSSPWWWLLAPFVYLIYVLIVAQIGNGIGYGGSRYPYPFLDVDLLGWPTVLTTIGLMAIGIVFLGYLFVICDAFYASYFKKKRP